MIIQPTRYTNRNEKKESNQRTAFQCFNRHDCGGSRKVEMRENCGACVLNGYVASNDKETPRTSPNYSGWARLYVEGERVIPNKYKKAFIEELKSENKLYAVALAEAIFYFGLRTKIDRFRSEVYGLASDLIRDARYPIPKEAQL